MEASVVSVSSSLVLELLYRKCVLAELPGSGSVPTIYMNENKDSRST